MDNKKMLGDIGEKIVSEFLGAILSENYYDSTKDMTDKSGKKVEVKTQNRHPYKNCFSIKADGLTNVKKCLTVDRLIFVEYDKSDVIKLWECKNNKSSVFNYTTNMGKKMYGWPIREMTLLHTISDKNLTDKMRKLSNSKEFS